MCVRARVCVRMYVCACMCACVHVHAHVYNVLRVYVYICEYMFVGVWYLVFAVARRFVSSSEQKHM